MIVIPRELVTLLTEAGERHQREPALDFAEHTVELCGDRLTILDRPSGGRRQVDPGQKPLVYTLSWCRPR